MPYYLVMAGLIQGLFPQQANLTVLPLTVISSLAAVITSQKYRQNLHAFSIR
jgi:hypothetical protein